MSGRKLIFLTLFWMPTALFGQGRMETHAYIEKPGSVPPVQEWYSCIHDLDNKPFDRPAAEACLTWILSHPHLTAGKLIVKPRREHTTVLFRLESPSLTVAKVNNGLPPDLEAEFEHRSSVDRLAPHVGKTYNNLGALMAIRDLDDFLKSKGILALATCERVLDYDQKIATVKCKVWKGPSIATEGPVVDGIRNCEELIAGVNETDSNDYTPLPYVNAILGIGLPPCFSVEKIEQGVRELKGVGIFSVLEAKISPSERETPPDEHWREVTLTARTNPTKVGRILYKRYGVLSEASEPDWPRIPLTVGQAYTWSGAQKSENVLADFLTKPEIKVKVFQEDKLEPDLQLTVIFHLIGGTADALWMDGKRIH